MKLQEIHDEVKSIDPGLEPEDRAYHAAVVLLSALQVGQSPKKLAEFTGYTVKEIKEFSANLRASNVWNSGRTYHSGWFDDDEGGIAFLLDVNIALGHLERAA